MQFQLVSPHQPAGDQPQAIATLVEGLRAGRKHQILHGITGSGKTETMANVIQAVQRPALVMSHNKTLARQLYREFKALFPHNAVHFFISDYLYFRPQTYVPPRDRYIDKRAALDEVLTFHRTAAAMALLARRDTIVVASVSCIFDIGSPEVCRELALDLTVGDEADPEGIVEGLTKLAYRPATDKLDRKTFRAHGPHVECYTLYDDWAFRVEVQSGRVHRILAIESQSGDTIQQHDSITIYPARLHLLRDGWVDAALLKIETELHTRLQELQREGKLLEAQRVEAATSHDIEDLRRRGRCPGMEVYCRHLNQRLPGAPPDTLIHYFPDDFLLFIDESHVTIPQVRGMHSGDQQRMRDLVDHGFRLPSAMDCRPLTFAEYEAKLGQVIYVSATPGRFELNKSDGEVVSQVIRPTGLLDPEITVEPAEGCMEHLLGEVRDRVAAGDRVLVTTLTKASAEEVANYLSEAGIQCRWLHDELDTNQRVEVLDSLRQGKIDALVGINLLREGIDLPQVSLVAILDADKAGFLRSETAIIQIAGRAARNSNAKAILYAETITGAMTRAIVGTRRRRELQQEHNRRHGIVPRTIVKDIGPVEQ
jgi:excinuclease ABC subunit B